MSCNKVKGPTEDLDYVESYSDLMAATSPADVIATSTWVADNGMVVGDDSHTDTETKVWLSGGRNWSYATAVNSIVTSAGREYARKVVVEIRPK